MNTTKKTSVNKTIKKIMIDRDLTLSMLAKMTGVTPVHLCAVINGRMISYPLREKIAFALNVSYESLWRHPDDRLAA